MFNYSRKTFRLSYFVSSFFPAYFFLLIILFFQHFDETGSLLPLSKSLTVPKIIFGISVTLFIISIICLTHVMGVLKQTIDHSSIKQGSERNKPKADVSGQYNIGLREFLLSVLIPVITTMSIQDSPYTGLVSMILLQTMLYYFYKNSSEILPNLSMQLIGYSVVKAVDIDNCKEVELFVKTKRIDEVLLKRIEFIYLGSEKNKSIIGITLEG